jgi:hypothetical protein
MRNDDTTGLDLDDIGSETEVIEEEVPEELQTRARRGPKAKLPPGPEMKGKRGRKPKDDGLIVIPEMKVAAVEMRVKGVKPIIVNHFSNKSKEQMVRKQTGTPTDKKAPKVPIDDFLGSLYSVAGTTPSIQKSKERIEMDGLYHTDKKELVRAKGRFGFPAQSFKLAAVAACRYVEGLPMTRALGAFHVAEDLVEILDMRGRPNQPLMREDIVRLNSGPRPVADVRYRAMFLDWMVKLTVRFNERVITPSQIAHLLNIAGFSVGVGEWRPEKRGSFGMFEVI